MSPPPNAGDVSRLHRLIIGLYQLFAPACLAFLLTTTVVCSLYWPLPLHLRTSAAEGVFHDGHVWAFDQMARMATGDLEPYLRTSQAGFPKVPEARFIAWAPALAVVPFRPWFGPLGSYNLAMLGSLGVGAAVAALWIRRVTGVSGLAAGVLGSLFGLSPFALGCLASGQTCKAQIWILPASLLLLLELLEGARATTRLLAGLGFVVVVGLGGVTEPTHVLLLPFMLVVQGASSVLGPSVPWRQRLLRLVLALLAAAAAALVLRPVSWYYNLEMAFSIFRPADRPVEVGTFLRTLAQPRYFWSPPSSWEDPRVDTIHVAWLGRVLLVAGIVGLLRRARGRALGLGLVVIGMGLALGEVLYVNNQPYTYEGARLRLPAWWLAQEGYPLARSAQYYRAVVVASLGLPLLIAAGLSRFSRGLGAVLALVISAAAVTEVVWETRELWPRPSAPVPGLSLMAQLAADPEPGGVLEVPVEADFLTGQRAMLSAAFHRRPTSAMPRIVRMQDIASVRGLDEVLRLLPGLGRDEARARLHRIGFRYVVWRAGPAGNSVSPQTLVPVLGSPELSDGIRYWVIDDPTPDG